MMIARAVECRGSVLPLASSRRALNLMTGCGQSALDR
ncbi:MAG: hypothetical protein K0R41_330 [Geminicoccaceae bacterium]|jgi:hypothetical protein|nr:hypothetical protein [Geminicoccaceae bacterium]MCE3246505.1 hypothetical protein [Geminicoccaceae bacterium]MDF2765348.1 hypothetical protein [Rhodospirillales bacterium]